MSDVKRLGWNAQPIGLDESEEWLWQNSLGFINKHPLSRRRFLQVAGGTLATTPSIVHAQQNISQEAWTTGLRFDLSADGEVATVTMVDLPIIDGQPSTPAPSASTSVKGPPRWRLRRGAFGPNAEFRMSRTKRGEIVTPKTLGGWSGEIRLHVRNASLARRGPGTITFIFSYEEDSVDARTNPRKRWSVRAETDLWLGPRGGRKLFMLGGPENPDLGVPFLALTGWTADGPGTGERTALSGKLATSRINCTLLDVFNGLARLDESNEMVSVTLDAIGLWTVSPETTSFHGLAEGVKLPDLRFGWVRDPAAFAQTENGEVKNKDAADPGQDDAAKEVFELTASLVGVPIGCLKPPVSLEFPSTDGPTVGLSGSGDLQLILSASPRLEPEGLESDTDTFRAEAALYGRFKLETRDDLASGPFDDLTGLLRRRVDVNKNHKAGLDPMAAGDELVFFAGSEGREESFDPRRAATIVDSPLAQVSFAVSPLRQQNRSQGDDSNQVGDNALAADPFGNHAGTPVFLRATGRSWSTAAEGRRTRWLEINGLVLSSRLALPDASFSQLNLHPTDLVFFYTDQPVETAPRNYIWLGENRPSASPLPMRLDLSAARLEAARSRDLISLKFGFRDLFLVHDGTTPSIRPRADACGVHARAPGLLGRPGPAWSQRKEKNEETTENALAPTARLVEEIDDTRPVLVVEFPPQHILEEAFFRPGPPPLPDMRWDEEKTSDAACSIPTDKINLTDNIAGLDTKPWLLVTIDANGELEIISSAQPSPGAFRADDGAAIEHWLRRTPTAQQRAKLRQTIQNKKRSWYCLEKNKNDKRDFEEFVAAFKKLSAVDIGKGSGNGAKTIPEDQKIYIGPFGMDPDIAAHARKIQREKQKDTAADAVKAMFAEVDAQIDLLTERAQRRNEKVPEGLELEALLESVIPSYQLFRSFYRDDMAARALGIRQASEKGSTFKPECTPEDTDASSIEYFRPAVLTAPPNSTTSKLHSYYQTEFTKELTDEEPYRLVEGRLANPSRLAFRVNCVDGLARARNTSNAPWLAAAYRKGKAIGHDIAGHSGFAGEHPAAIGVDGIEFSLAGLTDWSSMELSVIDRAEEVFLPAPGRRLDARSRRRINLLGSAKLDRLGFLPGFDPEDRTWHARAMRIAASLRKRPSPYETAIELARLTLSPSQQAVFRGPSRIEPAIYCDRPQPVEAEYAIQGAEEPKSDALWHARLMFDEALGDPQVRAVHSPDLAPDFVDAHRRRGGLLPIQPRPANGSGEKSVAPGGGAPPRGPYAPWLLDRSQTSFADLDPGSYAAWVADANGIGVPDDIIIQRADGARTIDRDALCEPDVVKAKDFRAALPHMIDALCRRYKLRKRTKEYPDPRDFRSSLDAFDRHELVLLTSAFGLPVQAKSTLERRLPGTESNQFAPDEDYQLIDILPGSEIYRPRALSVSELTLTTLGMSLVHDTSFEPPAAGRHADGKNLFDALSIERWQHRTSLGRDIFCEVVYKGYLFPFMFPASLVKVTQRVFEPVGPKGTMFGFLRQRMYIRCSNPEKDFPLIDQPDQGRAFPPGKVLLVTDTTPDIVDPNGETWGKYPDTNPPPVVERATGRLQFRNAAGLAFWPRTLKTRQGDVRFELKIGESTSNLPLLFVDNVAANDPETLATLKQYYNDEFEDEASIGVESPDLGKDGSSATRAFQANRHRRSLAFSSAKIKYADEEKTGSASIETDLITLRAEGRRLDKPKVEAAKNVPSNLGDHIKERIKEYGLAGTDFRFDGLLRGVDQPPIYPVVETARIRLKQNEVLTGSQSRLYRAFYDGHYVAHGFARSDEMAGQTEQDASSNAKSEARYNGLDVFLTLLDPASQKMNDNGEQSGGVFQPSAKLIAVSRRKGPVAASLTPAQFGAPDLLRKGARLGIAPYFGERALPPDVSTATGTSTEGGGGPADQTTTVSKKEEIRTVLQDVFADARLLGLVKLKDAIALIGDEFLTSVEENAPGLQEIIRFSAALTEKAEEFSGDVTEYVRRQLLEPLSGLVKEAIRRWEALDEDLRDLQSNKVGLTELTVRELFPALDGALRAFDAAVDSSMAEADDIAFTISLSVVYERGQTLIDETKRAARNPVERFEAAFQQRVGELKERLDLLAANLNTAFQALTTLRVEDLSDYLATVLVPGEDKAPFVTLPLPTAPLAWVTGLTEQELRTLRQPHIRSGGTVRPVRNDDVRTVVRKMISEALNSVKNGGTFDTAAIKTQMVDFLVAVEKGESAKIEKYKSQLGDQFAAVKAEIAHYSRLIDKIKNNIDAIAQNPETAFDDPILGPLIAEYRTPVERALGTFNKLRDFKDRLKEGDIEAALFNAREILVVWLGIDVPVEKVTSGLTVLVGKLKPLVLAAPLEFSKPLAQCEVVETGGGVQLTIDDKALEVTNPISDVIIEGGAIGKVRLDQLIVINARLNELRKNKPEEAIKQLEEVLPGSEEALAVIDSLAFTAQKANADFFSALVNDASMVAGIEARLKASSDDGLELVKNFRSQFERLIAFRKTALRRSLLDLRQLLDEFKTLMTEEGGAHARARAFILAGAGAAALVKLGSQGNVDPDEIADDIKNYATGVARSAVMFFASHGERVCKYLRDVLKLASDQFGNPGDVLDPQIEKALTDLLPNFQKELIGEITALHGALNEKLDDAAKGFEKLAEAANDLDTNSGQETIGTFTDLYKELNGSLNQPDTGGVGTALKNDLAKVEKDLRMLLDIQFQLDRFEAQLRENAYAKLDPLIRTALTAKFIQLDTRKLSIIDLYEELETKRRQAYEQASGSIIKTTAENLLVWPSRPAIKRNSMPPPVEKEFTPAPTEDELKPDNDRLAGDVAWLKYAKPNPISNRETRVFLSDFLTELVNGEPTPVRIADQLFELLRSLLKGDISLDDFIDLQELIEGYILDLVPAKIEHHFDLALPLPPAVEKATLGIFKPSDGCRLTVRARISVDLFKQDVTTKVEGRLGAFDVKLVGDLVDALTLRFGGAEFKTREDGGQDFEIVYLDYLIGRDLEFIQDLQSFLSPKEGSGAYVEPMGGLPGIEAGYRLNLGVISLGTASFFNVSLNTAARLPFTNGGEAVFRVSLSSAASPFTISYAPFGGAGFVAIDANARGIVGFELGFDFGAAGAFAVGPLTGQGRLMAGLYIRTLQPPNQPKISEISATFFAGGSANIWIFNFAASLYVKLGMVNGNMTGLAVFTFSFSMGIVDYDYSVRFERTENKGYSGASGATTEIRQLDGVRFAASDGSEPNAGKPVFDPGNKRIAQVQSDTVCLSENWEAYLSYFDDNPAIGWGE